MCTHLLLWGAWRRQLASWKVRISRWKPMHCCHNEPGYLMMCAGLGVEREIHVEPGLYEWLGWYQGGIPRFLSVSELIEWGFPVDASYTPILPTSKYNMQETTEQHYERCFQTTRDILRRHENEGRCLMRMFPWDCVPVSFMQILDDKLEDSLQRLKTQLRNGYAGGYVSQIHWSVFVSAVCL